MVDDILDDMRVRDSEIISLGSRPIRDVGECYGQTFDKDALEKLGVVTADGDLVADVEARQVIYADGRIVIDLPDDVVQDQDA